jgi:DNA repair protein RadD
MAELREHQARGMKMLYEWFEKNDGHPCLVMPTGSGKSYMIAFITKDAMQWPGVRVLMLTHDKRLIKQNAEKLREAWPNAPLGIYSAGLNRRELGEPIIFGGIQSLRNRAESIGFIDLIIIDEAHLINHNDEGGYRRLIADLTAINPDLRVIGLTATPYRLGHGLITDAPAIFSDLIEVVTIEELVHKGQLAILKSKITEVRLDVSGVHKRGGDYIESELQAAVDTAANNSAVVDEIVSLAGDRRAWIIFCSGIAHAEHIAELLNQRGINTACLTSKTPLAQEEKIIADYKSGVYRAVTNANKLTTGFDYPDIDLIAMLRPTMSPGLYVQMAGRGLRLKSHTDHCLVLDFAGVVSQHGPITAVNPPTKKGDGSGNAPVKLCPECSELLAISARVCTDCGYEFPPPEKPALVLHDDDIMGLDKKRGREMVVRRWQWFVHTSKTSGKPCLAVTYSGENDSHITEYFTVWHGGYAGEKSIKETDKIVSALMLRDGDKYDDFLLPPRNYIDEYGAVRLNIKRFFLPEDFSRYFTDYLNEYAAPPRSITYEYEGKFPRVIKREF